MVRGFCLRSSYSLRSSLFRRSGPYAVNENSRRSIPVRLPPLSDTRSEFITDTDMFFPISLRYDSDAFWSHIFASPFEALSKKSWRSAAEYSPLCHLPPLRIILTGSLLDSNDVTAQKTFLVNKFQSIPIFLYNFTLLYGNELTIRYV